MAALLIPSRAYDPDCRVEIQAACRHSPVMTGRSGFVTRQLPKDSQCRCPQRSPQVRIPGSASLVQFCSRQKVGDRKRLYVVGRHHGCPRVYACCHDLVAHCNFFQVSNIAGAMTKPCCAPSGMRLAACSNNDVRVWLPGQSAHELKPTGGREWLRHIPD